MKRLPNKACTGCMACADICPRKAIDFNLVGGFYEKHISYDCVDCGLCEKVCPIINPVNSNKPIDAFSASIFNEQTLNKSASGGVFAGIASFLLQNGSLVCGAVINGTDVSHEISDSEFEMFQGSKYLQSNTKNIYSKVEKELKANRTVLFSGTPCQVAGMLSYARLKKLDISNLFTIELVCHGVPSFYLVNIYEKQLGEKIKKIISFRDKVDGWNANYATTVLLQDGKLFRDDKSCFTKGFSGFKILRWSCYDCPYKNVRRCADITIGDLWGNKNQMPIRNGLSLVLVNSEKGSKLLNDTSDLFELKTIKNETFWLYGNPNIVRHNNPYCYSPFRMFLTWNVKHLPDKVLKAIYCGDFSNSLLLKKIVHIIDYPFEKILQYERNKKCKKVLSDFFD